jgi:hypothetical protein
LSIDHFAIDGGSGETIENVGFGVHNFGFVWFCVTLTPKGQIQWT